jgi:hypothetical protein
LEFSLRRFSRLALVVLLFLAWSACLPAATASTALVLTHVTVIDAVGNTTRPDQSVVILDGRITANGPSSRIKLPKDARIIDAHGKFLIPGLWDMHVHIAGLNADPAWSKQVLLPLLLANGITGVRDMGGDLEALLAWKREIESGTLVGLTLWPADRSLWVLERRPRSNIRSPMPMKHALPCGT